jgi:hypothetical protein
MKYWFRSVQRLFSLMVRRRAGAVEYGWVADLEKFASSLLALLFVQKVPALYFERRGRLFYIPARMGGFTLTFKRSPKEFSIR